MKTGRNFLLVCLALAAAVTFVACSVATATELDRDGGSSIGNSTPPWGGGDDPIKSDPIDEPPIDVPLPGGAQPVEPQPGIVDAIPHAWDHIDVASDGRTLTVYYWGGVADCYGLDRVDVARGADGRLTVTVFEGRHGSLSPDTACIAIALLKAATVVLDAPLITPSA
jgi:hypothetical protein